MKTLFTLILFSAAAYAQFGTARQLASGPTDPATCNPPQVFFNTTSGTAKACVAANTWGPMGTDANGNLTITGTVSAGPSVHATSTPPAYTPVAGNLVANPSFETSGSPHWASWNEIPGTGATIADETVIVHSGSHAVKLVDDLTFANNPKVYANAITTTASTTHYFSFWTRGDGFNAGTYMIRDVTHGAPIVDYTTTGITVAAYTQYTGSFTTPAGCTQIYIMFTLPQVSATAYPPTAWFDDVVISTTPITPDPTSPTATNTVTAYPQGWQQGTTPIQVLDGGISLGGVAAPGAPTVATGAAGALTGTYHYVVTFVTLNGESGIGTASAAVSPSAQKVNLTGIPTSSDPTVIGRNLFREKAGVSPGPYYFLASLNDNTTTTYTDNTADGSLGYDNHYLSSSIAPAGSIWAAGPTGGVVRIFKDFGVGLAIGQSAGQNVTTWDNTLLVGDFAGSSLTASAYNTLVGAQTGRNLTTQNENTCIGGKACYNTGIAGSTGTAQFNTFVGGNAGFYNKGGYNNTFIGDHAGDTGTSANANLEGHDNTFVGYQAGPSSTTQYSNSTAVGSGALATASNQVVFGNSSVTQQCFGSGICWYTGAGAPAINCSVGSLYSNTSGGANTTLYVCTASNTWTAQ